MQILPKPIKALITERLQKHVKSTYTMSEEETKTIEELVTFLSVDVDKPFDEFFWYVNRHDTFRKESFPIIFPELYNQIVHYAPSALQWGVFSVDDIVSKTLRESKSADYIYSALGKRLREGRSFQPSEKQALKRLESKPGEFESKPAITFAVFAALAGVPLDVAASKLSEAVFTLLSQNESIRKDPFWNRKISVLRICTSFSEDFLSSITITDKELLVQNLSKVDLISLVKHIEKESGIFSSTNARLHSGGVNGNHSSVFKDVANAWYSGTEIKAQPIPKERETTSALEKLTDCLASVLTESKQAKEDPVFPQKIAVLRVCALNSEGLLCSLVLTEKDTLAKDIYELSLGELMHRVEIEHCLFSSFATQLITEKITWDDCSIFKDCASIYYPENHNTGRWILCEQWSYFFRDSKHLITLYCTILHLPSTSALAERLVHDLRSMQNDDSPAHRLEENLQLLEHVLRSEAQEMALVDFLQTGRSKLYNSLKEQTPDEVRALINKKYGIVAS